MVNATFILQITGLLLFMCVPGALSYFLAKNKGRNAGLWTVLGLIPFLNLIFLLYFIFAKDLRREAKLEKVT